MAVSRVNRNLRLASRALHSKVSAEKHDSASNRLSVDRMGEWVGEMDESVM